MMKISILSSLPPERTVDCLMLPYFSPLSSSDWAPLARHLEMDGELLKSALPTRGRQSTALLQSHRSRGSVVLLPCALDRGTASLRKQLQQAVQSRLLSGLSCRRIGLDLSFLLKRKISIPPAELIQAAVEGSILGDHYQPLRKTRGTLGDPPLDTRTGNIEELVIVVPARLQKSASAAADTAWIVASTQRRVIDLVNAPPNLIGPRELADTALASGQEYGYQVSVKEAPQLEEEGFGALLAVGRGSCRPPLLAILEYRPGDTPSEDLPVIGLVGKGVTFDTGGISLKNAGRMALMKSDMAGAAAVLGAIEAAARLQLPVHLIGLIPAAENKPDANAQSPSEVITSYAGLTIEVEDTDAEGRLILADALAFLARNYRTDQVVDLATLTGAAVVALGKECAALFSNNDDLAERLVNAGEQSDERLWRLPCWPAYDSQIESDVADIRNYGGPTAGAITAARFIQKFTGDHPCWAHLDIAGVAFPEAAEGSRRRASGFGVRLLARFLTNPRN